MECANARFNKASSVFHFRIRQLGVFRDKQTSAAEVAREEYFFCGLSPIMFVFIPCLSRMTSEISRFFAHCEIPNLPLLSLVDEFSNIAIQFRALSPVFVNCYSNLSVTVSEHETAKAISSIGIHFRQRFNQNRLPDVKAQ